MAKQQLAQLSSSWRDRRTGHIMWVSGIASHPGWNVWAAIDDSGDVAEIVELGIVRQDVRNDSPTSTVPAETGSVSAAIIRSISLTEILAAVRPAMDVHAPAKRLRDPTKMSERSPAFYATWASLYVAALEAQPRRAVAALAEAHNMDRAAVRDVIHRCRSKGYLTPGAKGKSAGELTDLAARTLKEMKR